MRLKIILFLLISLWGNAQIQKTKYGKIDIYQKFPSQYITARNIEVWLPEGYNTDKKYAVLYMHDGQMLFDPSTTWNKQAWKADSTAISLMKEKKVKDFIIVGVWNGEKNRHPDYFPQKPFETLSKEQKEWVTKQLQKSGRSEDTFQPQSDNYLKFLVYELKPFIDGKYPVNKSKENTYIMGSSMGGLISMYAIMEYPDVFGGAACLSTHWPGVFTMEENPVPDSFYKYLEANMHKIKKNKIYFDYGDKTLDALYPLLQKHVDSIMKKQGFASSNWKTEYFPGKDHSENAWAERLSIPMEFLLGK